jgi:hypothetical protein
MLGRWTVRACSRGAVELKWVTSPLTWVILAAWVVALAAAVAWMVAILGGGMSTALLWPAVLLMVSTAAAVPSLISVAQQMWTIGTVHLRDGVAEAEYLGPGRLPDVRVLTTVPAKVETRQGSSKETLRRVVAQAAGGEETPLGPWLPPGEAARMAECLNRAYSAKRAMR